MSVLVWTPAPPDQVRKTVGPKLKAAHLPVQYLKWFGDAEPPPVGAGRACMAMGKGPVDVLKKHKVVPGNLGIRKMRERPYAAPDGGHFFVSWDPNIVNHEPERAPEIAWDANLVARFLVTGSTDPVVGEYRWVDDFGDLCLAVHRRHQETGRPVELSCDLETVGLDEWNPDAYIVSIGFSMEAGTAVMRHFENAVDEQGQPPQFYRQVRWLLTTPAASVVGANFKYDGRWLRRRWGVRCTNLRLDTTLVGSLVDENRNNTLNMHTKVYVPLLGGYDDPFNAKYDKGRMDLVPRDELTTYAGGDLDAGLQVARELRQEILVDRQLARFYVRCVHPAARAFETIEHRGMVVDLAQYELVRSELKSEVVRAHGALCSHLPARMRNKYVDDLVVTDEGVGKFKDAIVQDFLYSQQGLNLKPPKETPSGRLSVDKGALAMLDGHPAAGPFIEELRALRAVNKTLTTYVIGFLAHLRSDGRFHPTYMLHRGDYDDEDSGSTTGRSGCKDPAYQTIPKHTKWAKPLRRVFVAPPGYVILAADFSQGELRITACVADEPTMIQAYRSGIDLHSLTAATINGMPLESFMALPDEERELKRFHGKAGNFGLIYGMMPPGFVTYARTSYGVELSLRESETFREKFFGRYPLLLNWHERSIEFARRHGYVRSPMGRVRHLPMMHLRDWKVRGHEERRAINNPVQATLTDMGQLAIAILHERYPDLWTFGFTHDELAFYVPEDDVDLWAGRVKEVMETLPLHEFGWRPQLGFPADLEAGPNLADRERLKLAA